MTSELSFLVELLLKHKLPSATKDLIASRIKDVEANLVPRGTTFTPQPIAPPRVQAQLANQSPSTQALLAKHPDLLAEMSANTSHEANIVAPPRPEPAPVTEIAQTPAAMAAIEARNNLIAKAYIGTQPMKTRKFR